MRPDRAMGSAAAYARRAAAAPAGDEASAGAASAPPSSPVWWLQGKAHGGFSPVAMEFLRHLGREKRRAERTGRPLSLVIYRIDERAGDAQPGDDGRMADLLHACCRETDIAGLLADDLVAVLCTDTDEKGVLAFMAKVEARAGRPWFTAVYATYPEQLFEQLERGDLLPPALHGLLVQEIGQRTARSYRLKRPLDVAGAAVLLLLLAPLMALVALLVALTSPGPVIFRQRRLGQHGRPFTFYKFRSMRVDGDDSQHRRFVQELVRGAQPQDGFFKMRADPRITPVGRVIRRTSLDELPQLFNVLKGDMSLVGPRPPIAYEARFYDAWHLRRVLCGKPGITGLWQVEGRSRVSFDEMVRLDLRYLRECSLWLDLRILLKTVLVVLRCDGAA